MVCDEIQLLRLGLLQRPHLDTLESQHLTGEPSHIVSTQSLTHKAAVVWEGKDLVFAILRRTQCLVDALSGNWETVMEFVGVHSAGKWSG